MWERGNDGKFVRQLVYKRENEEILSQFTSSEKIYNVYWNECDCCHAFESTPAQKERDDWFNSDEDDLDLPEVDAADLVPTSTSENASCNPPPTAPPTSENAMSNLPSLATDIEQSLVRWEPYFRAPDRAHSYDVGTSPATEILHYFFGFVPPLPVPQKHPRFVNLTEKDYKLFAAIVDEDGLDAGFRDSTIMQYCHQFVKGLERNNTPPNELFDLAIGNPKYLGGVNRILSARVSLKS